ncbi:MAG: hypothetical protein R3343_09265 [Nitriliruptorales bacterium]|nr:hypothetical protein [Nitriliruptorales bacterium]
MDTATVYELIGYVGSGLVVVSLMMRSILRLRIVNLIGALVFTVYGVLIDAPPVWVVNGAIVLIDLYHLAGIARQGEDYFEVLEVETSSSYLRRFLEFHADGIGDFLPSFDGLRPDHTALFVLRDVVPAGLVLARPRDDDTVIVDLDYVIPGYRDRKVGTWVYRRADVFGAAGFQRVLAAPGSASHRRYLERMGFEPTDGRRWELEVGTADVHATG